MWVKHEFKLRPLPSKKIVMCFFLTENSCPIIINPCEFFFCCCWFRCLCLIYFTALSLGNETTYNPCRNFIIDNCPCSKNPPINILHYYLILQLQIRGFGLEFIKAPKQSITLFYNDMLIFQVIFWSKPLLPNYQAMKNKATSYFLMSTQGQFADGGGSLAISCTSWASVWLPSKNLRPKCCTSINKDELSQKKCHF